MKQNVKYQELQDVKYQELNDEQLDQVVGGQGISGSTFTAGGVTPVAIGAVHSAAAALGANFAGTAASPIAGLGLAL